MLVSCQRSIEGVWKVVDFTVEGDIDPEYVEGAKNVVTQYTYKFDDNGELTLAFPESMATEGMKVDRLEDGRVAVHSRYALNKAETELRLTNSNQVTKVHTFTWISGSQFEMRIPMQTGQIQIFTLEKQ